MTIKTHSLIARSGAILHGVVTPWASMSGTGVNSALPQNFGPVVVTAHPDFVTARLTEAMAQSLVATAPGLPTDIRKQYVHKTRVNVGGDGASGPNPEREPA